MLIAIVKLVVKMREENNRKILCFILGKLLQNKQISNPCEALVQEEARVPQQHLIHFKLDMALQLKKEERV